VGGSQWRSEGEDERDDREEKRAFTLLSADSPRNAHRRMVNPEIEEQRRKTGQPEESKGGSSSAA
jgi:hypothetical protein